MRARWMATLALLGGAIALGGAVALAVGQIRIEWDVLSSGGGSGVGGQVAIVDSLGQPVVGGSDGGGVHLEAGFWAGVGSGDRSPTPTGTATATPGPSATPTATHAYGLKVPLVARYWR